MAMKVEEQAADLVATHGPFLLTKTGLVVQGHPTFEEWEQCGAVLKGIEAAAQFWIGDWVNYGEKAYGEKYSQALDATGLAEQTLYNMAHVARKLPLAVRVDGVPFTHHAEVAALPAADQVRWLGVCKEDGLTRAELRTAIRLDQRAKVVPASALPDGPFRVLYADPPWAYGDSGVIKGSSYGHAEGHYPTMTVDELIAMPVKARVQDDAVLFFWATAPQLLEKPGPIEVMEAWGFKPKTGMVWDKVDHNYGHYVSVRHEHLIIATRGSCTPDCPTPMPDSVQSIRRSSVHSQKPAAFRALIDALYPLGARVELFAREKLPAPWVAWGNVETMGLNDGIAAAI